MHPLDDDVVARRSNARSAARPAARKLGGTQSFDVVRKLADRLPGVEEGLSYGTPALRVRGKLFARIREDDEDALMLKLTFDDREALMRADPKVFFITEHYRNYPCILVRLSRVSRAMLGELLEDAWRLAASKRLIAQLNSSQ
jgi:hypothetical protein